MPERLRVEALRDASIDEVDAFLRGLDGAQRLRTLPKQFAKRFTNAWRIPVEFDDARRDLLAMVDADFPFSLPRIAVEGGPELLDWPHLERDGLLCVVPNLTSSHHRDARSVIQNVLAAACELISHNVTENTEEELRDEFLSYWSYACGNDSRACISIVTPKGPTREIVVWKGSAAWYFADDEATLKQWLNNRFSTKEQRSYNIRPAWLMWRGQPWLPTEYPTNSADLLAILKDNKKDLSLDAISRVANDGLAVLVGAPTASGNCFAALAHSAPGRIKHAPKGHGADPKTKGFRPGHVPLSMQLSRALASGARMDRCDVKRADAAWVHGRDQDPQSELLGQRHVAVVGIGSLGSEITALLGQSGVGTLGLIDGETLEWANISRHRLGAASVGMQKAKSLSEALQKQLPHITIKALAGVFGLQKTDIVSEIFSADLIVSVTGNWGIASLLNAIWLDEKQPPDMVVTWMEAHAAAAHSIHFSKGASSACLQCEMTPAGRPHTAVTEWQEDPVLQVPACGGAFMPYGPVGLAMAAALGAEHCIDALCNRVDAENHRIWVGKHAHLARAGGAWSQSWVSAMGEPGSGGFYTARTWSLNTKCIACGVMPS